MARLEDSLRRNLRALLCGGMIYMQSMYVTNIGHVNTEVTIGWTQKSCCECSEVEKNFDSGTHNVVKEVFTFYVKSTNIHCAIV